MQFLNIATAAKTKLTSTKFFAYLSGFDWRSELQLVLTASLVGGVIVLLEFKFIQTHTYRSLADWVLSHLPRTWIDQYILEPFDHLLLPSTRPPGRPTCGPVCISRRAQHEPNHRVVTTDNTVTVYGWPSRGGVIVLEEATHVDFEWLGLSTVDPPLAREYSVVTAPAYEKPDVEATAAAVRAQEDQFCQRLLLLGAKWWDSEARFNVISSAIAGDERANELLEEGRVEEPTLRERRWVKVGWEVTSHRHSLTTSSNTIPGSEESNESWQVLDNGLWVLSCDTTLGGILEEDNLVPHDAGRLKLARSMEERCLILKGLGATYFRSLREYKEDSTYLTAWEWWQVSE